MTVEKKIKISDDILRRVGSGELTLQQAADIVGTSKQTIWRRANDVGIRTPRHRGNYPRVVASVDVIRALLARYRQTVIARTLGIRRTTLSVFVRANDLVGTHRDDSWPSHEIFCALDLESLEGEGVYCPSLESIIEETRRSAEAAMERRREKGMTWR